MASPAPAHAAAQPNANPLADIFGGGAPVTAQPAPVSANPMADIFGGGMPAAQP